MVIIAKGAVEFNGHIYHKGEACKNFEGEVTARIAYNFVGADGKPLTVGKKKAEAKEAGDAKPEGDGKADEAKDKIAKCVEVMKREGIIQALEGMGITYSPKAKTEFLAKLLLMNKGEIEE